MASRYDVHLPNKAEREIWDTHEFDNNEVTK